MRRTGDREPGAGSREPGAGSREPGAGSREPGAGSREPGAGSREDEIPAMESVQGTRRVADNYLKGLYPGIAGTFC
jgi:hypothetical protein